MRLTRILLVVFILFVQHANATTSIRYGSWLGKLKLTAEQDLPFRIILGKGATAPTFQIQNAEEQIDLVFIRRTQDTLVYEFKEFDSQLNIIFKSNKTFAGYWWNRNKKDRYTIQLEGHYCTNDLFECQQTDNTNPISLAQQWKAEFSYDTASSWPAIGLFQQGGRQLSGTFLTETGDYRYLAGNLYNNRFYLSCFDGSHAFLFTAEINSEGNRMEGKFYSGTGYSCNWKAEPNAEFTLNNPEELTYIVNENPLTFSFPDLDGKTVSYPNSNYKDKVTIIQIMGSWCPNCLDETRYFKELYNKYHDQGLEIIMIGYEAGSNTFEYAAKLKRYKSHNSIPFTMLVGGAASKNKAAEDFSMLNDIISFPTSIIINRKGEIKKVHTGFNGPGTGQYYTDYVEETDLFIQELLRK